MITQYKYSSGDVIKDNNSDIKITKPYYNIFYHQKMYEYICLKCDCVGCAKESTITKKRNICLVCSNRKVVCGINDIAATDSWMIPYLKNKDDSNKYHSRSRCSVEVICPDCGRYLGTKRIDVIKRHHGIKCICNGRVSYPEKFFVKFLEDLNIKYIKEYSPEWIKPKRFDFYIPKYNLIVELNGKQHYVDNCFKHCNLQDQILSDDYKYNVSLSNGILYYYKINASMSDCEYIKRNIIKSGLLEVIHVSPCDINWERCAEFAENNLTKMVAEFYNDNRNCAYKDICNYFNISMTTVVRYIQIGVEHGWIENDVLSSHIRTVRTNANKYKMKKVKCVIGDGIFTYNSIAEASRKTGIERKNINACCLGKRKSAGGYIWKYA